MFDFRFLDAVEEAIHTPNCPIWDINFRPMLPLHAQPRVQQQQNQSMAQQAPNLAAVISSTVAGKAVTPATTISGASIVKKEPCESMAEAEEMEVDQPHEHPSAASTRSVVKDEPRTDAATAGMTQVETAVGATIPERMDDLSKDLILEVCKDLNDTQFAGDKDVSFYNQ